MQQESRGWHLKDDKHLSTLFTRISKHWKDGLFSDIQIVLPKKSFHLHKIILASSSEYFRMLFTSIDNDKLSLKNINENVMEKLVQYMYTGEINVEPGALKDVYLGASLLQLETVSKWCLEKLNHTITTENCVQLLHLSKRQTLGSLQKSIETFIASNFCQVYDKEDFVDIPFESMCQIFQSDYLRCDCEYDVYQAFKRWLAQNDEYRMEAKEIMKHIRFALIPVETNNQICREDDLMVDEERAMIVHRATEFLAQVKRQPVLAGKFSLPRSSPSLLVIGGATTSSNSELEQNPNLIKETVQFLSIEKDKLEMKPTISAMPGRRMWGASVTFNNFLYFLGGTSLVLSSHNAVEKSVFRFSPLSKDWLVMSPMLVGVRNMCAGVINQTIFVIGGWTAEDKMTDVVQCYDIDLDKWSPGTSFPYPVGAPACCVIDNTLYISGGSTGIGQTGNPWKTTHIFKSVQSSQGWQQCCKMYFARYNHQMVSDGYLAYIFGGLGTNEELLSSAELFNPMTSQTTKLTAMPHPRASVTAVFHNGLIYVPGGSGLKQGEDKAISQSTIYIYNTNTNSWSLASCRLPIAVEDATCALLVLSPD